MVALGKAARVEVEAGAGDEVTQNVLGNDPYLVAVLATAEPRAASEAPASLDSSPGRSCCSSTVLESDGISSAPPAARQGQYQHQDRPKNEHAYRALIRKAPPTLSQAREEEICNAKGDDFGSDFPIPRRSPPGTSERKESANGPTDDDVDAKATRRVTAIPTPAGPSSPRCGSEQNEACGSRHYYTSTASGSGDSNGGRGNGGKGDVRGGVSVGVGAGVGGVGRLEGTVQEDGGSLEGKVCAGENDTVVAAVIPCAAAVEEVEPSSPPRRSLLDLAYQSIDDI